MTGKRKGEYSIPISYHAISRKPQEKVTRQVPLHSGTLSVMYGQTQRKNEHTIVKSIQDDLKCFV